MTDRPRTHTRKTKHNHLSNEVSHHLYMRNFQVKIINDCKNPISIEYISVFTSIFIRNASAFITCSLSSSLSRCLIAKHFFNNFFFSHNDEILIPTPNGIVVFSINSVSVNASMWPKTFKLTKCFSLFLTLYICTSTPSACSPAYLIVCLFRSICIRLSITCNSVVFVVLPSSLLIFFDSLVE